MALEHYRRKRDFRRSPEPPARAPGKKGRHDSIYCIQKHDASRLHYDLRLQLDGVLKSWAVPKGPSLDPHEKRLAVQVEDHPIDYAKFEGTIPEGYGAGEVIVWDYGSWKPLSDPERALKKGRLDFELHGEKLHGRWILVRTRGENEKAQWLLIKRADEVAKAQSDYDITDAEKESVLSGRTLSRDRIKTRSKKLPFSFVQPQLAQLAKHPPEGDEWIHEVKFDGYRTLCGLKKRHVQLLTRTGLDWTSKYPPIAADAKHIRVENALLDGEIVSLNEKGQSDFQLLQENIKGGKNFTYYVFDLLALDGEDLRDRPLQERKDLLRKVILKSKTRNIRYSEHWPSPGKQVLRECCKLGLEGIVSKDKAGGYISGRGNGWIKTKCGMGQEFVIIGFTEPEGSRVGFGSLLLATNDKSGNLVYAGHVGTGFNQKTILDLMRRFKDLKANVPPIAKIPPGVKRVHWLKPKLLAEVSFSNWTREKILRHPSFKGLRLDKPAKDVTTDKPITAVKITNPEKVLIPAAQVTKQDIAEYYRQIQKWILPHLVNRPLALFRCPNGIGKSCFFQKNLERPYPPDFHQETIDSPKGKTEHLIYIDSLPGLMTLVQMAVMEIHIWGTHREHFKKPDQIVFDLDPGPGVEWHMMVTAARTLKNLLTRLKLKAFLKTTGSKGLHVHVPIQPEADWDQVKAFAHAIAQYMSQKEPDLYLANMAKAKRQGRIFIDYLRNGYGATAVAPYSLRARAEAGVAFPISWSELEKIRPTSVTIKNAAAILAKRKIDPWRGYNRLQQRLNIFPDRFQL